MAWQFHDLGELSFSGADLKRVPLVHAGFLVASSFAFNEIGVLLRLVLLALNARKHVGREPIVQTIAYIETLVAERMLSAKIVEYCKLFDDYLTKVARKEGAQGERLVANHLAAMRSVKTASGYETARWLRDTLTNHYLVSEMEKFIGNVPDGQSFTMYLNEKEGNSSYPLGEEVAMMGKLNADGQPLPDLRIWQDWIHASCRTVSATHYSFVIALMEEFFPDKFVRMKRVVVDDLLVGQLATSCTPILWDFRSAVGR